MIVYNPYDVFVVQRNATSSSFVEKVLSVTTNSLFFFDSNKNVTTLPTSSLATGVSKTASYLNPGANIYLDNSYIFSNTSASAPGTTQEGQIWWDKINHTYTIAELDSQLQIGQENYIRAIAGENIRNGDAVYIEGSDIDPDNPSTKLPVAYLALADVEGVKSDVVGLATQDITPGSRGFITTMGVVNDIDTSMYFDGDTLYLSPTNSGSYVNSIPSDPYPKVKIGFNLYTNASTGRILVSINNLPQLTAGFVGMTTIPSISITNFTASIGTGSVNLCTTADGIGSVKSFTLPPATLYLQTGLLNTQFVVATYNSGSPVYRLDDDRSLVDSIQTTFVYTINPGVTGTSYYVGYDTPGTLLANKLLNRVGWTHGLERGYGLSLGVSSSLYAEISSGSVWNGVNNIILPYVNSAVDRFGLLAHSASVYTVSLTTQMTNTMCDNGVNVVPLGAGINHWVVNYIYRGITNSNASIILYSQDYTTLIAAQSSQPPEAPAGFYDFVILVGRVIYQKNNPTPVQIDSAFVTSFTPSGITIHNDLTGLQGTGPDYYHLTAVEYGNVSDGPFVRTSGSIITGSITSASVSVSSSWATNAFSVTSASHAGKSDTADSASWATTASWALNTPGATSASHALNADNAITASWALNTPAADSSSHAIQSDSASYIVPGATLYVVSSSTNPSYIEPYNIPVVPYNPPYKEGRLFYDKDYSNWVYYTDQNFKLHLGKEVIWRVYNSNPFTLPIGTPVYLSGSTNMADPDVFPGIADGTNRFSDIVGVIRFDTLPGRTGYVIQAGVIHGLDMTGFNLGDPVFLSPTVLGGITNVDPQQPFESVRIGNCQAGGVSGSIIISPVFRIPPVIAYSGMTSEPIINGNFNNGTIAISTGSVNLYGDPTGFGGVLGHPIAEATLSLITGSTNYVIAYLSGSTAIYDITTDSSIANDITVVRVAQLDINTTTVPGTWDVHQFNVGIEGLALANRSNNKDIRLYGFQRENGLTLYTTGSNGYFGITEGSIWYGPNDHIVELFDTTIAGYYTYLFTTTGSVGNTTWNQTSQSIYLAGYYDSGSGDGLTVCAPNSWSVNFVYRLIGTTDEAAIVLSNAQFSTAVEAIANATTPPNLPPTIADQCLLVGRFVVQSGSYASTIVQSSFTNIFATATVTNHENLTGLQGGTGGQHEHLTNAEYVGTGTGVFMRNNKPVFAGATPGHIPYWKSDQTLTLTGSVQVYLDQYVLINSGSPDPTNPEALLVLQKNTGSENTIGAYATVNNFSQIYNQNLSSGSNASTDIVATNDTGSQENFYIDIGVASSQYNDSRWPWVGPNDAYLENDGGNLWIATLTDNSLKFTFNNTASTNYADKTGFYLSGSFFGTSSFAYRSVSASWADSSPATTLFTASTYQITASQAVSASWAPGTGEISSSWASQSLSASYAPVEPNYSASVSIAKQNTLVVGGLYQITSSWATQSVVAISSSWADTSPATTLFTASTYQITSSNAVSSSWADTSPATTLFTASTYQITSSNAVSSSWADTSPATTLFTASTYQITSSVSVTASYSVTSSVAVTASYAVGVPTMKSGLVSQVVFGGSPQTTSITFAKPFVDNNYSVVVTGKDARIWTIGTKNSASFVINSNSDISLTDNVFWQAMTIGEFYS